MMFLVLVGVFMWMLWNSRHDLLERRSRASSTGMGATAVTRRGERQEL